jgi:hypothetical protein
MPARLVQIIIRNKSRYPIRWLDDHLEWGDWQNPWWPSKIQDLQPGNERAFRSESGGPFSGTEGWALFTIDVPLASNVGDRAELLRIDWDLPYWGGPKDPGLGVSFRNPSDRPKLTYAVLVPPRLNMATNQPILGEFVSNLVIPAVLFQGVVPEHISWTVELRNIEENSTTIPITIPIRLATQGIIYVVTPVVEARLPIGIGAGMGGHPASGGDLMWCRHDGRDDGSFAWQGPKKVGTGWGELKQVFSGGDGIIYGVDPVVKASVQVTGGTIHPSGGNLWWYRHVGRDDGSFTWEGPKKVGTGWGEFTQVFSGGDGIIYGITPIVEATIDVKTGQRSHASGGDLMWYRHVGRDDGSFTWEGPKKVGNGWGELNQVFSGD